MSPDDHDNISPKTSDWTLTEIGDDFPDGFHDALGRVVVAFGRLEYMVKLTVKTLSRRGFTAGMAEAESLGKFKWRCDRGKQYASQHLPPAQAKAYGDQLDMALRLVIVRNDMFHAVWTTREGSPLRLRPFLNAKTKDLEWRNAFVSPNKLHELATSTLALYRAIDRDRKMWALTGLVPTELGPGR